MEILITGADGSLGSALRFFFGSKHSLTLTSNKKSSPGTCYIDFRSPQTFSNIPKKKFDFIFDCAGITNIASCEKNPEETWVINVENKSRFLSQVASKESKIFYFSSNTVFDCERIPNEDDTKNPIIEYGKQKSFMEDVIRTYDNGVILRLSKVVSFDGGFFENLLANIAAGNSCSLFFDLHLAPIFHAQIFNVLSKIIENDAKGIFHVSNQSQWSYYDFGAMIAKILRKPENNIIPVSASLSEVPILFNPKFSQLSMIKTSNDLKIQPVCEEMVTSILLQQMKLKGFL